MPHSISFSSQSHIITITYLGEVDLDERIAAVEKVCEDICVGMAVKILVDVSVINNTMSHQEQAYFGQYLADKAELKNAKVAVLSKDISHNPNMIINNTAYLEGYHLVPFASKTEAIYWLDGCFD
ncbi:MAG: hypothetical protein ACI9FJ_002059 [Alteromonadaceae bacterium]|jgi:hypothetical protein